MSKLQERVTLTQFSGRCSVTESVTSLAPTFEIEVQLIFSSNDKYSLAQGHSASTGMEFTSLRLLNHVISGSEKAELILTFRVSTCELKMLMCSIFKYSFLFLAQGPQFYAMIYLIRSTSVRYWYLIY